VSCLRYGKVNMENVLVTKYRAVVLLTEETFVDAGEKPSEEGQLRKQLEMADVAGVDVKVESFELVSSQKIRRK
jgi:hypothetical protein